MKSLKNILKAILSRIFSEIFKNVKTIISIHSMQILLNGLNSIKCVNTWNVKRYLSDVLKTIKRLTDQN